jgi:hypothetical protein
MSMQRGTLVMHSVDVTKRTHHEPASPDSVLDFGGACKRVKTEQQEQALCRLRKAVEDECRQACPVDDVIGMQGYAEIVLCFSPVKPWRLFTSIWVASSAMSLQHRS